MRMLVDGFWCSLGVIFVKWEIYFDVSPAKTSLVGSIFMLIVCSVGKKLKTLEGLEPKGPICIFGKNEVSK